VRIELGQLAEADNDVQTALRLNFNDAFSHNLKGVILSRLGKRDEAAAEFETALRINPDHPEARRNLLSVRGR
jgi:Flp pilus assembly protein TadD